MTSSDDALARAIAERDQALAECRLLHERLNVELAAQASLTDRIIANAPLGIGFMDRDLVFRWANERLAGFLGLTVARMVGQNVFDLLPEAREYYGGHMRTVLDTGTAVHERETPFHYVLDGQPRTTYWDYSYLPMTNAKGEVDGVLVVNVEVSERVNHARMLNTEIERLTALDRLKSDFVNTISHELRTPLTGIRGYIECLADGLVGDLTPAQHEVAEHIQAGTQRLQRLFDDLLDFAHLEAGVFQLSRKPVELGALIQAELDSLAPQLAQSGRHVSCTRPPKPLTLSLDAGRIRQVLSNLIANAIKFSPPGAALSVSLTLEDTHARVCVRDSGIGVAPEHHLRIFDKFHQVDPGPTRAHGGAGLGLAVAKGLIEAHGGEIGIESTPGAGATFWFTLPLER